MTALSLLTVVHVVISLVAIALGIPAIRSILSGRNMTHSVVGYFLFTALTTLTGFAFPISRFTPGIAFGIFTVVLLAVAAVSIRNAKTSRRWQFIYLLTAVGTLYLNCIVLIVQSFQKISFLAVLAPTQTEPPFLIAQVILLLTMLVVVWKGFFAHRLREDLSATNIGDHR